jgi:hypothetical protein
MAWGSPAMRYYFDMIDGEESTLDEIGLDLAGDEAALEQALRSLGDWGRDCSNEIGTRNLVVIVHNRSREVGRLRLRLEIEITPPPVGTI